METETSQKLTATLELLPEPLEPSVLALSAASAVLVSTYIGYPLFASLRARFRPMKIASTPIPNNEAKRVSCILAAHDEGKRLVEKVRNLLGLDYPADKLEILIADDGSTDGSPELAAALDPARVQVVRVETHAGKANAIAQAVPLAKGEILLLCDVRQRFDDQVVREIVEPLTDPDVGAVSGQLVLDASRGPGAYWRYESMIRRAESKVDSVIGATGAIYAIRRELFPEELPRSLILDDVYIPMTVVLRDYRVILAERAIAYDTELSVEEEYPRKVRTLAGNYQLVALLPELLDPFRNRLFWPFLWHKLARLVCPWALVVSLVASAMAKGLIPFCLFLAQLAVYVLAAVGQLRGERAGRLATVCNAFVSLHVAAVMGLFQALRRPVGIWAPTRQAARIRD